MQILPIVLFCTLFAIAIFAPLRWSLVAYLMLTAVDFYAGEGSVGYLNALKGLGYPIVLLWRLKMYSGHGKVVLAPVAWMLLIVYSGIASFWSLFPLSAAKLTAEMLGSFLICLGFMRATKAGFLSPSSILVPTVVGVLGIGVIRMVFLPNWGDAPDRFTGLTTAQGYASLLAALFALALGARTIKPWVRWILAITLFSAVVLDGSRIYVIGLIFSTMIALLVSYSRPWLKVLGVSSVILIVLVLVAEKDLMLQIVLQVSRSNRVANTINAVYEGNMRSSGVGTFMFRKNVYLRAVQAIGESSLLELTFGHGTSNGRLLRGTIAHGVGDPNRAVHNEWLRILFEWGGVGLGLWFVFIGSIIVYAIQGVRRDRLGYSRPLLIFMPAFLAGFSTENILAGAGHASNIGFVLLAAMAAVSHRRRALYLPRATPIPYMPMEARPRLAAAAGPYSVTGPVRRPAI